MKIKTENMPEGLPPGEYEVEMVKVEYTKGRSEPIMYLRFMPPPKPKTTFLLVEVETDWAHHTEQRLTDLVGIKSVSIHNENHPHGCCCQHCPHGGNCRD